MTPAFSRILILEDEAFLVKILSTIFKVEAPTLIVDFAKDGQEGLDIIAITPPDIIILDVIMPGMDGPTFMEEFTRLHPDMHLPVVLATASPDSDTSNKLLSHPLVMGLLDKPYKPREVIPTLMQRYNLFYQQSQPVGTTEETGSELDLEMEMQKLTQVFIDTARNRVGRLGSSLAALRKNPDDIDSLQAFRQVAHSLAGACGSYGFPEASQIARNLDTAGRTIIEQQQDPTQQDLDSFEQGLQA